MNHAVLPPVTPWVRVLRPLAWGGALVLLAAPWVAMRFTDQVAWSGGDFAVFGALLLFACLAFEVMVRTARAPRHLAASVLAIATAFLLVWANLAVGIVEEPNHPANLMFAAVLLAGVIGAVMARLHARGMAHVLLLMACLQVAAGAIAVSMDTQTPPLFLLALTAVCSAAWLLSAWLYHAAAARPAGGQR